MKCDDLENKDYNNGMTAYELMEENGLINTAKTVKDAIAELKAKLDEKDAEIARLESMRKVHVEAIASMEDRLHQYEKKIRRLRRALWLARAERAKERKIHFDNLDYLGISFATINFESARTWMTCKTEEPSKWAIIFEKVERKCRAKAE